MKRAADGQCVDGFFTPEGQLKLMNRLGPYKRTIDEVVDAVPRALVDRPSSRPYVTR